MIDKFTKEEFSTVVENILSNIPGHRLLEPEYVAGELRYSVILKETHGISIIARINSSIGRMGLSAANGENSIRVWITDQDDSPIGNKIIRWIDRRSGWEVRLHEKLHTLYEISNHIEYCTKCNSLTKVWITKKDGPNKGRLFKKCECDYSFRWLDMSDENPIQETSVQLPLPEVSVPEGTPHCPKCNGSMKKKFRRSDNHPFWSCNNFPNCKGSRNIEDAVVSASDSEESRDFVNPMGEFTPSKYQVVIADWMTAAIADFSANGYVDSSVRALVVEALAGSGKTTTGINMLKLVPKNLEVIFISFNVDIVGALKDRLPSNVSARTYNSIGNEICRNAYGNSIDIDDLKVKKLLGRILPPDEIKVVYSEVKKLVSLVKANLSGVSDEELFDISNRHGIELNGNQDKIFECVKRVVLMSAETTEFIDYNDQCWLPVFHDLPAKKYDILFIDEAQDTNRCQIELALKSVKPGGIIIAVGDRHQSLYGFRGANVDAIPNLIESLNADVLPLSITYRNPRSVVKFVNERFPYIPLECSDTAEEGHVYFDTFSMDNFTNILEDGDMILCRTNAPLVKPCFELIKSGKKAVIRGRDIGSGLIAFINKVTKKYSATTLLELLKGMRLYTSAEYEKLMVAERESAANAIKDKEETIIALCAGVESISELKNRINSVFSNDQKGIVFSSIHKSKGLEADNVFIMRPDLLPHPMAKKEWEVEQEKNIEYVAYTRAKSNLYLVSGK